MVKFPDNFMWGAATSGPQSEGTFHKQHESVFDYHFHTQPEDFWHYIGPDVASNFYNDYENDIKLMKQAGINYLRTSIQWTRLIKDLETGEIDPEGAKFYRQVFETMIANGVTPMVNLHHFDMPVELQHQYGGWQSKHVVELYVKFATKAFELYGDIINDWFTFNEPKVVVDGQYLYKWHYPNIVDGKKAVQVAYNLNLASAKAIAAFRKVNKNPNARIGNILNLTPAYSASDAKADQAAAHFAELWSNTMFLEPAIKGTFPSELIEIFTKDGVMFEYTSEEFSILKENTIDFLGINYYHPFRVKAPDVSSDSLQDWMPDIYFDNYQLPGRRMNVDKGWEIYPEALYDIAIKMRDDYPDMPWFVSENGMGVEREERFLKEGIVQDDYRIKFISDHLTELAKGINAGSNCSGYFVWTGIDCWSWLNSYKNRYGLIRDDLTSQTKTLKKSGHWYKQLSETNEF